MIKEFDLFGVYLSPMVGYAIAAALVWLALRPLLRWLGAYRWVWHQPLFDVALFMIVLAGFVVGTWHLRP